MAKTFGDFQQITPVPTDFLVGYRAGTETRTTVDSLCASLGINDFLSNLTTTQQNSAGWSSAYTTLNANSAQYGTAGTTTATVNANSATWSLAYTSFNANSGSYDAATALVNTYNSRWILESGNTYGSPTPMVVGNLTNEKLSFITNGVSRLEIANTGDIQINGGSNATVVTTKLLTADFTNPEEFVSKRYVDTNIAVTFTNASVISTDSATLTISNANYDVYLNKILHIRSIGNARVNFESDLPAGFNAVVMNESTGNVTLTSTTADTYLSFGSVLSGQQGTKQLYSSATVYKYGSKVYAAGALV